jgi:hypothetical protein
VSATLVRVGELRSSAIGVDVVRRRPELGVVDGA